MIHRLSQDYLDRQESLKNWRVFAGYVGAATVALALWTNAHTHIESVTAFTIGASLIGCSIWLHWALNRTHKRHMELARRVEVEVENERFVFRTGLAEHAFKLSHLVSVSQTSKFGPIKLGFSSERPFQIDGLEHADLLVKQLSGYLASARRS